METKYYIDTNGIYLGGFSEGHPDIPQGAIEISAPPETAGLVWTGASWITPKPSLISHLADYRYQKEINGIILSGLPVPTDDRSKMLIAGAYNKALQEANPELIKTFKINGAFVAITNQDIINIALYIAVHVQNCFTAEGAVFTQINADIITTKQGVETAFDAAYAAL